MTVAELILQLQSYPQDLPVCRRCYSEWVMFEAGDVEVKALCYPRPDDWVHDARPDKPLRDYLAFEGN